MTLKWSSTYPTDADTIAYMQAVEAADGQALELDVVKAYDEFILGCKHDGIWDAIKSSCILAGARTLSGALVPLVGTAPTNNNFVSGYYNRNTGLVGDGTTKYLNSNRANNADPQNNQHLSVYQTELSTSGTPRLISGRNPSTSTGSSQIADHATTNDNQLYSRYNGTIRSNSPRLAAPKCLGVSRDSGSFYTARIKGSSTQYNDSSAVPNSDSITVFANPGPTLISNARLSFYSIGEALDLALLDNRVSALMTTLGGLSL